MSNDLRNIIHQRLMFAGNKGYTRTELFHVLKETVNPSMKEIADTMRSLENEGIAKRSSDFRETNQVFKLASYTTTKTGE